MRGRTLSNAVVIFDEAQNTTSMQMKMLLTRLGENSRRVVTGDPSQVDLPPGENSGFVEAVGLLDGMEGIAYVAFNAADVSATSWSGGSSRPTTRPRRPSVSGGNDAGLAQAALRAGNWTWWSSSDLWRDER